MNFLDQVRKIPPSIVLYTALVFVFAMIFVGFKSNKAGYEKGYEMGRDFIEKDQHFRAIGHYDSRGFGSAQEVGQCGILLTTRPDSYYEDDSYYASQSSIVVPCVDLERIEESMKKAESDSLITKNKA
jgi:hypothetical protein